MSENYDQIEEMQKAEEATGGGFAGKEESNVQHVVNKVIAQLGIRNRIDDVRLDNIFWQINFGEAMSAEERKKVRVLVAEALSIEIERIKLVAVYPH